MNLFHKGWFESSSNCCQYKSNLVMKQMDIFIYVLMSACVMDDESLLGSHQVRIRLFQTDSLGG